MRFCRDEDNPGWFWLERGVDDKVDHFDPCHYCAPLFDMTLEKDKPWGEADLCNECLPRLEISSAIDEVRGSRPINLDRDLTEIIQDDFPRDFFRDEHITGCQDIGSMYERDDEYRI